MKKHVVILVGNKQHNQIQLRFSDPKGATIHRFVNVVGGWQPGKLESFVFSPTEKMFAVGVYILQAPSSDDIKCEVVSGENITVTVVASNGETAWPEPPLLYSTPPGYPEQEQDDWPRPPTAQQIKEFRLALKNHVDDLLKEQ